MRRREDDGGGVAGPRGWLREGDVLGERFSIVSLTGSGGMGRVYRARDAASGADVALKVLVQQSELARQRFSREARVLAELQHPAVVRYIAHGETPTGDPYLVMEWIGDDLEKRLRKGPLSVADAVRLFRHVASGLMAAHARGIIHRDIKPSNLLLDGGDLARAKLADFGLVASSSSASALTQTGELLGTPSYMAPEQVRGDRVIDARADVFACGCVLYECLTGKLAFGGPHVRAVLARVLFEDAPRVSWERGDIPPALDSLLVSMLARDPERRPKDGARLHAILDALVLAAPSPSASPARLGETPLRWTYVVVASPPTAQRNVDGLGDLAVKFGGEVDRLADGTIFVLLRGAGTARDSAAIAARCAMAVIRRMPDARVALAALRSRGSGTVNVGDVIDRAVAHQAAPGSIAIDDHVASLLDSRFRLRPGPADTFELEREDDIAERPRLLLGKQTPVVGRERELANLRGLLDEVKAESLARAVLVTAGPGVGKSRLRQELVATASGFEVWTARADPMSAGSPMRLAARLLREACGIREGADRASQWACVEERVNRHVASGDRARVADFLGEIVGVGREPASPMLEAARLEPVLMADGRRSAFESFIESTTRETPLLIVIEDLHWGDLPSIKLLDAALRRCTARPLAVVALARPEVEGTFPGLWSERRLEHLRLSELSPRARERLVRHMLGDALDAASVTRLGDLSEGNAFYLEELIRAAANGAVSELPRTVVATVQARLDALDAPSRRVLHLGSVFGHVFWLDGVRALLPLEERAGASAVVDALVEQELLQSVDAPRFDGARELAFRHALVREATYESLVPEDARAAHAIAADWLIEAGEQDAFVLAEHLERGGLLERAAVAYADAATVALGSHDLATTLSRSRRGLVAATDPAVRMRLRNLEGEALLFSGGLLEAARYFQELLDELHSKDTSAIDLSVASSFALQTAMMAATSRGPTAAARVVDHFLAVRPDERDRNDYQRAAAWVVSALACEGAVEAAAPLVAAATAVVPKGASGSGWQHFIRQHWLRHGTNTSGAREVGLEGARVFRDGHDAIGQAHMLGHVAIDELSLGAFESSYEHALAASQIADQFGLRLLGMFPSGVRAVAAASLGRFDEARQLVDDTERLSRALGDGMYGSSGAALAAFAARLCGDAERGASLSTWAAARAKTRWFVASANVEVGASLLALGRAPEALERCLEALELNVCQGLLFVHLKLWATIIGSYRALGRHEEADAATARARVLVDQELVTLLDPTLRTGFLSSPSVALILG